MAMLVCTLDDIQKNRLVENLESEAISKKRVLNSSLRANVFHNFA